MKAYSLALIGCSATKLDRLSPARELYTGPLFKLALEYAQLVAERVLILSAEHGAVSTDLLLEPYDTKLTAATSEAWGARVSRRLATEPRRAVLFLAGDAYFAPLDVPDKGNWHRPLKGLGIGKQKAKLRDLIAGAPVSVAELVLRIDRQLYVPGPEETVGEVAIDSADWDRLVRAAREEQRT